MLKIIISSEILSERDFTSYFNGLDLHLFAK